MRFVTSRSAALAPLVVALAAGCSRQDTPPAPSAMPPASATAATPSAASPAPTAPASAVAEPTAHPGASVTPTVELDDSDQSPQAWKVKATGLPAVSADGALVAYVARTEASSQGYSSEELVLRHVGDDKVEHEVKVFDPKETIAAESAPNASGSTLPALVKKLHARADEATALLKKSSWFALGPTKPVDRGGILTVRSGGVELTLQGGKLAATQGTGRVVAEADAHAWGARGFSPGHGAAACSFEPRIADASVDPQRHVLLVRVEQAVKTGGEACEALDAYHALKLN